MKKCTSLICSVLSQSWKQFFFKFYSLVIFYRAVSISMIASHDFLQQWNMHLVKALKIWIKLLLMQTYLFIPNSITISKLLSVMSPRLNARDNFSELTFQYSKSCSLRIVGFDLFIFLLIFSLAWLHCSKKSKNSSRIFKLLVLSLLISSPSLLSFFDRCCHFREKGCLRYS